MSIVFTKSIIKPQLYNIMFIFRFILAYRRRCILKNSRINLKKLTRMQYTSKYSVEVNGMNNHGNVVENEKDSP